MLTADQFVASKSLDERGWLEARREGLSATTMSKAMTESGYREVVASWGDKTPTPVNAFMEFGLDNEWWLALWAKEQFGTMPNDWLIRHEVNDTAIATPDGLSLDHGHILEVKTTGKDWARPPINYMRQVQWQLYVTGAEYCYFVWLLREEYDGRLVPAWLEPKYTVIDRDEAMILDMVYTADELWTELRGKYGTF
jgi:predicted phage-related endonuclease